MNRIFAATSFICILSFVDLVVAQVQLNEDRTALIIPDDTPVRATFLKVDEAFWLRLVDAYKEYTTDDVTTQQQATKFLKGSIQFPYRNLRITEEEKESERLFQLGSKLVDDGCDDPLVLTYFVDALKEHGLFKRARSVAKKAVKQIDKSDYPQGLRILPINQVRIIERQLGTYRSNMTAITNLFESGPEWFRWCSEQPDAQRHGWEFFDRAARQKNDYKPRKKQREEFPNMLRRLGDTWLNEENLDLWIRKMMLGLVHEELAWHLRGEEYADELSEEQWDGFVKHLTIAAKHLISAYELNPERPEAAGQMIGIASQGIGDISQGSDWDWFLRSISAELDYETALTKMFYYRLSRWGGSEKKMYDFALICLETNRYDTRIPYAFIHAINMMKDWENIDRRKLLANQDLFETVREVLTKLAQDPSRKIAQGLSRSQSEFLSELACYAIETDRSDVVRNTFEMLGDDVSQSRMAFYGFPKVNYQRSRAFAYGEFGDELLAARDKMTNRFPLEKSTLTNRLYRQWLSRCEDDRSKLYLESWRELSQMEMDFHAGDWIELEFDPEFLHWSTPRANWTYESPNSALASSEIGNGSIQIHHHLDAGGPKEVTAEIELVSAKSSRMTAGISIGSMYDEDYGRLFFIETKSDAFGIAAANKNAIMWQLPQRPTRLNVRFWDPENFQYSADGFLIPDSKQKGFGQSPESYIERIGLGGISWKAGSGVVRIKNVRVRKLSVDPPPRKIDEAYIKYYDEAIKRNPTFGINYQLRAEANRKLGHPQRATKDFTSALKITPKHHIFRAAFGRHLFAQGQYDEALEQFSTVYNAGWKHALPAVMPELALLLAAAPNKQSRDPSLALEVAKQACEKTPKSCHAWCSLAAAEGANGNFEEASKALKTASELQPSDYQTALIAEMTAAVKSKTPLDLSNVNRK